MAFLESSKVKVYPSAYRGVGTGENEGKRFNPESRLITEENMTRLGSEIIDTQGFIVDYIKNETNHKMTLFIKGRYFELDFDGFTFPTNKYIHAVINIKPRNDVGDSPEFDYADKSLSGVGTSVDVLDDEKFKGIELIGSNSSDLSLTTSQTNSLCIFKKEDSVYVPYNFKNNVSPKFSSDAIYNKTQDKPISEEFTTKELESFNIINNSKITSEDIETINLESTNIESANILVTNLKSKTENGTINVKNVLNVETKGLSKALIATFGDVSDSENVPDSVTYNGKDQVLVMIPKDLSHLTNNGVDNNNQFINNIKGSTANTYIDIRALRDPNKKDNFFILASLKNFSSTLLTENTLVSRGTGGAITVGPIKVGNTTTINPSNFINNDPNGYVQLAGGRLMSSNSSSSTIELQGLNTKPILVKQYGTSYLAGQLKNTVTLLDSSGNSIFPKKVNANSFEANNFNSLSDERLKTNIKPLEQTGNICKVEVKEFEFKDKPGVKQIGVIAQDLQKEFPDLVQENDDGYLSIKESKLVYLLLNEIKELKQRIELLEKGE